MTRYPKILLHFGSFILILSLLALIFNNGADRKDGGVDGIDQNLKFEGAIKKAGSETSKTQSSEDLRSYTVIGLADPKDWSEAFTELELVSPLSGNPFFSNRKRILRSVDMSVPILLHEELVKDPITNETLVRLKRSMVANQLVVSSRRPIEIRTLNRHLQSTEWFIKRVSPNGLLVICETSNLTLDTIENGIESLGFLDDNFEGITIEPNSIFYTSVTIANDPLLGEYGSWGLDNPNDWDIDAPEGWDIRTDASDIVIAVTDSGIRYDHEDLAENIWRNTGEIPNNQIDDDGNGYIDDYYGANVIDPTLPPMDDNGHGSHVAGIIGAVGNNDSGTSGVAWRTQLMAIKAQNSSGRGTLADSVEAIDYAVVNGAHIINASWGSNTYSDALESALERARDKGVYIVAAAGNEGSHNDETPHYPSNSELENVIAVAAATELGGLAGFSNFGINTVDLAAPGLDILSAGYEAVDSYLLKSGTSMATPYVTGILALNISLRPDNSIKTHVDRLIFSSKKSDLLNGACRSQGLVSLASSLALTEVLYPPTLESHSKLKLIEFAGETARMEVEVNSDTPVDYQWFFNNTPLEGALSNDLEIVDIDESNEGLYRLTASNSDGELNIEFSLNVLTHLPDLATGLDNDSATIVSPYEDAWSLVVDAQSREGDHIESLPPRPYSVSSLTAIVQGPGHLRFLWRMKGNYAIISRPTCKVGNQTLTLSTRSENWEVEHIQLEESRDYQITWEFRNHNLHPYPDNSRLVIDNLGVHPAGQLPPIIYSQPKGITVRPFSTSNLSVSASADHPTYKWYKNGDLIPNETSRNFSIRSTEASDAGEYHVVVSNPWGQDTSEKVYLHVDANETPAHFIERNKDFTGTPGEPLALSLDHAGSPPIRYQWYRDSNPIEGETGPELTLNPFRIEHSGNYQLTIENLYTSPVWSNSIWVRSADKNVSPAAITEERGSEFLKLPEGDEGFVLEYYFERELTPVDYQWYRDGIPIQGATQREYRTNSTRLEDQGVYFLEYKNHLGSARSSDFVVFVDIGTAEVLDTEGLFWSSGNEFFGTRDSTATDGDSLVINGTARYISINTDGNWWAGINAIFEGPMNLEYSWKRSSNDVDVKVYLDPRRGFPAPTAIVGRNSLSDPTEAWQKSIVHIPDGTHIAHWIVSGEIASSTAWLDNVVETQSPAFIKPLPEITLKGAETTKVASQVYSVAETHYQWYKNDEPITGATSSEITITSDEYSSTDELYLIASSEFGETKSATTRFAEVDEVLNGEVGAVDFGGDGIWLRDDEFPFPRIAVELEKEQTSWVRKNVTGPYIIGADYAFRGTVLIDGETVSLSGFGFPENTVKVAHVPAGEHEVMWKFEGPDAEYGELSRYHIGKLIASPAPLIIPESELVDWSPLSHWSDIAFYTRAEQPATVNWYRDGQLVASKPSGGFNYIRLYNGNSLPSIDEIGTYQLEIVDVNGNAQRSAHYEIRELDTRSLGETIGLPRASFDPYNQVHRDDTEYSEGSSSVRLTVPQGRERDGLQLSLNSPSSSGFHTYSMKLKIEGFDKHTIVRVHTGPDTEQYLPLASEWQSVGPIRANDYIYIDISKSIDSEVTLWVDELTETPELTITKQPEHYGTYLYAKAEFSIETDSLEATYQWRRNGSAIPGATSKDFKIDRVSFSDLGEYDVVASLHGRVVTSKKASLVFTHDLGGALGYPGLKIVTYGDVLWKADRSDSIDGSNSITSGWLNLGQKSTVRLEFDQAAWFSMYIRRRNIYDRNDGWELFNWSDYSENPTMEFTAERGSGRDTTKMNLDRLSFSPLPLQSYERWLEALSLNEFEENAPVLNTSLLQDRSADPDGDGIQNFIEYALGLNPFAKSDIPKVKIFTDANSLWAELNYRLSSGGDVALTFEGSSDLKSWTPLELSETRTPSEAYGYQDVKLSLHFDSAEFVPTFIRWQVASPGDEFVPINSVRSMIPE